MTKCSRCQSKNVQELCKIISCALPPHTEAGLVEIRPVPTLSSLCDVSPFQTPKLAFETPLKWSQLTSPAAGAPLTTGGLSYPAEVPVTLVEPIIPAAFLTQRSSPPNILRKSPLFPCTRGSPALPFGKPPAHLPGGVLSIVDPTPIRLRGNTLPPKIPLSPHSEKEVRPLPASRVDTKRVTVTDG